jgi:hypothetical protein
MLSRLLGDHQSWRKAEGLVLGLAAIVWGLGVSLQENAFATGTAYQFMVGPEWAWGAVFVLQGLIRLVAAEGKLHVWRQRGSILGTACWASLAYFFRLGNPTSPISWVLILFAVASIVQYVAGTFCHVHAGRCNGEAEAKLSHIDTLAREIRASE